VRRLALELNLTIRVIGVAIENDGFWKGVDVERSSTRLFDNVRAVIYPAYIEHQPRILIRAAAYGIPVITTLAAGISVQDHVIVVPVGDYLALKEALGPILETVETA
jgi:hypothetical protein